MKKMSTARRLTENRLPTQHCKDDLACEHCCLCWVNHKKSMDVKLAALNAKYEEARVQAEFLAKLNKETTLQLNVCREKLKKIGNIQEIKLQFQKEIEEQVRREREVQDAITAQKMEILEQEIQASNTQMQRLTTLYNQTCDQLNSTQLELENLQHKCNGLEEDVKCLKEENTGLEDKITELYDVIKDYENRVDEKEEVIDQLRNTVHDLQGRFLTEKARASSYSADKQYLQAHLRGKDEYIQNLTKCSFQNIKNLHNLQQTNTQLKKIVGKLDHQVAAGRYNENYLKNRLVLSEHQLVVAEDIARFNSQKVELMKNDLHMLKLTI